MMRVNKLSFKLYKGRNPKWVVIDFRSLLTSHICFVAMKWSPQDAMEAYLQTLQLVSIYTSVSFFFSFKSLLDGNEIENELKFLIVVFFS